MFSKHDVLETRIAAAEREYGRSETGTRDLRKLSLILFIALFAVLFAMFTVLGGIYWRLDHLKETQITQFNQLSNQLNKLNELNKQLKEINNKIN